jgi:PAS domain S-box-containing protein
LEPLVNEARDIMRGRIDTRRTRGLQIAAEAPYLLKGQQAVEAIRRVVATMEREERHLLDARLAHQNTVGRLTTTAIIFGGALAVGALIIAARIILSEASQRTRMAESLRDSEERLRLTIGSVTDYAIIQLNPQGEIISWNPGAERIKGYTEAEIARQHFSRFYTAEAIADNVPTRALATAAAEGRFHEEGWRLRKGGERFWASVVINAVRDPRGRLLGFVKLTRDLTQLKNAQERIQHLNDDLRQRAAALETANRELEAFSYSVSHDLRAPLRHIDGFANLLAKHADAKLDDQAKRFLATISRSARQMGELIDDLLAFSRIGRTPLRIETVDHAQLVRDVIAEGHYDETRQIHWEIGDLPSGHGDAAMLRQVWRNLIDNAVKYTGRASSPRIKIAGSLDPERQETVYCIEDNGVGFDMAYADKLFGVFQRLHGPSDFEGTGIGLANVRRIVARHDGRTWAEGEIDRGAKFYFALPVTPPGARPSA